MDLALERLTLSYNEMLRVENTGRDRKKVKKLLYYISELSPKHLMKQKMDAYAVHQRLRYLYGEEYGLTADSEPGNGTCIKICIPFTKGEEKTWS